MSKVMTMTEAISKFVKSGDLLFISGAQHGEPSAAIHEIVRQKIDHLTVVSCLVNSITFNAHRHGIELEGLEIKASCDVDPSVLFEVKGPEAHTACMPTLRTEITVKGDLSQEQLETIKRLARYSPVHGLIEYPIQVETTVKKA